MPPDFKLSGPPLPGISSLAAIDEIPLERVVRLGAFDSLACQHLPQLHPAMIERVGRAGHVDAPDAVLLLPDQPARLVGMCLQPSHPVPQGPAKKKAQEHSDEAFEATAGGGTQHLGGMDQF